MILKNTDVLVVFGLDSTWKQRTEDEWPDWEVKQQKKKMVAESMA